MKRLLKISVSTLMCLVLLCGIAFAAGPVDTGASCAVTLHFAPDGTPAKDAYFEMFKVASVDESCIFTVDSAFQTVEGLSAELVKDDPDYAAFAAKIAADALMDTLTPVVHGVTDANGELTFAGLETGLYLVRGSVYETEGKCYVPAAFMLSLPIIPGRYETPADDTWVYEYDASVKSYETFDRINVLKLWSDSEADDHADDTVTVELYADGKLVDSVALSKTNDWRYTWDKSKVSVDLLRSTKAWSVKESKGLDGYTVSVKQDGSSFTVTNTKDPDPDPILPQTGLLWWPVPVLLAAGIALLLIAYAARCKGKEEHD